MQTKLEQVHYKRFKKEAMHVRDWTDKLGEKS